MRTHRMRCSRHDSVLDAIIRNIEERGSTVIRVSNILTPLGVRKPDLIALVGETAYVVDVTVTADCTDMTRPYNEQVEYYKIPAIIEWVSRSFPGKPCRFGAVVLNWRGVIHKSSSDLWDPGVNISKDTILACRVLSYMANMFKHHPKSTKSNLWSGVTQVYAWEPRIICVQPIQSIHLKLDLRPTCSATHIPLLVDCKA